MSDLISRQAALDDIKAVYEWHDTVTEGRILDHLRRLPSTQPEKVCIAKITLSEEQVREAVEKAKSEIVQVLPSAQPERKKGKWIDYSDEGYVECPFCHSATNCDGNKDELHFCFSCGADMRGEGEE